MEACPDSPELAAGPRGVGERLHERRTGRELLAELVFRPLASLVVRALLPLGVSPVTVVLANGLAGLLAAGAPVVYPWLVLGCAAALSLLQLRREWRARRVS